MTDFRINVIVDPSRVPAGTRKVERELVRVENKANRLRTTLRQMLGPLAGGLAILGAVRAMAKFEESIATARAVTGATEKQFAQLRDRALELGVTTRFSATQAGDALVLLARAGFTVDESLAAVGDTLKLAQAGGLGLAEAADITASALRGFNLAAADTQDVTDVLTVTTNNANSNISELGQALKFVAPIAKGLNKDIRETSAALGILSDAGLKATLAGTGLRRVFAELESPGRELNNLLREAGLTADQVAPSQNELIDILNRLKKAGIDTGQALEIFGQRGGPAFQVLVSNTKRLGELNDKLKDTRGATKEVADIIDNTLNGALFRAKSAIEGFVLGLGQAGVSDFLIASLDGVAAAFRFAAQNADILQAALIGLATVGVGKLVVVLGAKLVPAMRAASLSMVLFRGNVLLAGAAFAKMTLAMTVNPFVAIAVAAGATYLAIKKLTDGYNEIGDVLNQIEEDSKRVPAVFAALGATQRELNNLNRSIAAGAERGAKASDAQIARVKVLEDRLSSLKGTIKEQSAAQKEKNEREQRGADITDALIERLERRKNITSALTMQQKELAAFQEELNKLEDQGATPSGEEKERIRLLLEETDGLDRQKKLFEEIKRPQEVFNQNKADLDALLAKGAISAGEFAAKLRDLQDALGESSGAGEDNSLDRLKETVALQDTLVNQGKLVADAQALENALKSEGVEITREVQDQIADLLVKQKQLTEEEKKRKDFASEAARAADRESRALDRLEQQINGTRALADEKRRLNQLQDEGRITLEQEAIALENLQLKGLEASRTLEAGFSRAFIKLKQEAEDLAAVSEKIVNIFADQATDALVKFAETGKFAIKDFASSILQALVKVIARLLVVQALQAAVGALGGGGGALATTAANVGTQQLDGARANGGPVQANRSYLVGENGPEIVTPNRSGTVIPNGAAATAPPEVNVQVVNVQSEDEIPQAINNGGADEAIINAIARNKDRVNQVTQ